MNLENYISIATICKHYQVEPSFLIQIEQYDIIQFETINNEQYLSIDTLYKVEKLIRLHHELNIHEENIDIVYNLINKVESLQEELKEVKKQQHFFLFEKELD